MIPIQIAGPARRLWETKKAHLKSLFPRLTESDLAFDATQEEELFVLLEEKLGITVAELKVIVKKAIDSKPSRKIAK